MDKILDKLRLYRLPFSVRMFFAKCFIRMLKVGPDDIILYTELRDWIETKGKPITTNKNYIAYQKAVKQAKQAQSN